jgi:hypothetical protein
MDYFLLAKACYPLAPHRACPSIELSAFSHTNRFHHLLLSRQLKMADKGVFLTLPFRLSTVKLNSNGRTHSR